jgi:hypothetical protein
MLTTNLYAIVVMQLSTGAALVMHRSTVPLSAVASSHTHTVLAVAVMTSLYSGTNITLTTSC